MNDKNNNIPKFMTEPKSIILFLASVLLFAILFIVVYQPLGYMRSGITSTAWNKHIYTTIQVFSGFLILVASRLIFYKVEKRTRFTVWGAVLWILGELVVIAMTLSVIAMLINEDNNLLYIDLLQRVSFSIFLILIVPYIITVMMLLLRDRGKQIEKLNDIIDRQQSELPAQNENLIFYDRGGKLAFSTKRVNVMYIEAADNYCNIHYMNEDKEETFILHNSMKNIDKSDEYKGLLRCHRGYMVNIDNVKLLRKGNGGLVLELTQGVRSIPVSKTYTDNVVKYFVGETN